MIQIGLHGGGVMRVAEDGSFIDVSHVTPDVLAHGLAHVTRFGGQAGPYSVAEHSVRMWDWAEKDGQDRAILRAILLHDAPEALGEGDHQRFVKRAFFGTGPGVYANLVCSALWDRFAPAARPASAWTWNTVHEQLKFYDGYIGSLEARAFGFPHDPIPDWLDCSFAPKGDSYARWTADKARDFFLERWEHCP